MGTINTKRKFACHDKYIKKISSCCVSNNQYLAGDINSTNLLIILAAGAGILNIRFAQVVVQPVRTKENFQEFSRIYYMNIMPTSSEKLQIKTKQISQNQIVPASNWL
jgi:hypothetical protein